jgi:hypothetical protein
LQVRAANQSSLEIALELRDSVLSEIAVRVGSIKKVNPAHNLTSPIGTFRASRDVGFLGRYRGICGSDPDIVKPEVL